MSPKNPSLIAGLAAPGLFWLATTVAIGQDSPSPQRPAAQAPTSPSATYSVLLLSNGTVVRGEITEDLATGTYKLRQRGGQVPYSRSGVKKAAGSIEEVYDFLVACLPVGDPDERMKLVRWCLTEHLPEQAKEQLAEIVAMCPEDREARMMLYNMKTNAEHAAKLDPAVRQTGGEAAAPADAAPAPLDPAVIRKLRQGFGQMGPPEIFDLTPALAVKRANEFAEYIHPIVQKNCAGCHNERHPGPFQLVVIKSKREFQNPDITRTNLDATLKLVNIDDPGRSDLLSLGLVPHGTVKGSVFKGPIDPQYRYLEIWVKSLKPAKGQAKPDGVARTGYTPAETSRAGDGFASDRGGKGSSPKEAGPSASGLPELPGMGLLNNSRPMAPTPPSRREFNVYNEDADFAGGYSDFPLPFAAGGTPPRPQAPKPAAGSKAAAPKPAKTAKPLGPDAVLVDPNTNPNDLPGMDQPLYSPKGGVAEDPEDPPKAKPKAEAKPKKKVDPALLEQILKNRNGTP